MRWNSPVGSELMRGLVGVKGYCTRRAVPPRPIAAALTCTAEAGTPAAASAAAMALARDRPRASAADWASGSFEAASPKPVTAMMPLPRRPASCFRVSVPTAGNSAEPVTNVTLTVLAGLGGDGGAGAPVATVVGAAGGEAGVASGAGAGGGGGTSAGAAATGTAGAGGAGGRAGAAAGDGAMEATPGRFAGGGGETGNGGGGAASTAGGSCAAPGGASGVLCTVLTGALAGAAASGPLAGGLGVAGAGGASAAAIDALACALPGGGGGGTVPRPNRPGEALGSDGSAIGAAAAICCALARSAISALEILVSAARSGCAGFGGTVARFGYGWSAPGGGGLSSAILPPCRSCHQLTGFIDAGSDEHPASSSASNGARPQRRPEVPESRPQPA